MTRTSRPLARLASLLFLGLAPASALAQQPAEDVMPTAPVVDKGSPVAAYVITALFSAGVLFAVCKSAGRSTSPL